MISRKLEAYATEKPDSSFSNGARRTVLGGLTIRAGYGKMKVRDRVGEQRTRPAR